MNKFKLLYLLVASLCLTTFTACDDDDDEEVSPNVTLLTRGEWTGSAVYYLGQDQSDVFEEETGIDITQYTSLFERDGTYTDRLNGDVLVDGTWAYENDERVIVFDEGTTDEYRVVISKLDEDELFYLQDGVEFRFVR